MLKKISLLVIVLCMLLSCDETIFVEDISEVKVHILAPKDNTTIVEGTIAFNWESAITDSIQYQLQIATPNFAQATQIVAEEMTTSTSFSTDLIVGDYEWRVRAVNSAYDTDYSTAAFTVN